MAVNVSDGGFHSHVAPLSEGCGPGLIPAAQRHFKCRPLVHGVAAGHPSFGPSPGLYFAEPRVLPRRRIVDQLAEFARLIAALRLLVSAAFSTIIFSLSTPCLLSKPQCGHSQPDDDRTVNSRPQWSQDCWPNLLEPFIVLAPTRRPNIVTARN